MALFHASSGDVQDVRPLGDRIAVTQTHALFKARQLEVIRLVLAQGRALPVHHVEGEITILCIEGSLTVDLDLGSKRLDAGELLFLDGGVRHGITALADASALVTIALT